MATKRIKKQTEKPLLTCSFCDKTERQVKQLVKAPKALICNECIDTCHEIIEEARLKELVWNTIVKLNEQVDAQLKT